MVAAAEKAHAAHVAMAARRRQGIELSNIKYDPNSVPKNVPTGPEWPAAGSNRSR